MVLRVRPLKMTIARGVRKELLGWFVCVSERERERHAEREGKKDSRTLSTLYLSQNSFFSASPPPFSSLMFPKILPSFRSKA
jgi:hypothetical protein